MRYLLYPAALALLIFPAAAYADENTDTSEWSGQLSLYGWLPAIKGDQTRPDGNPLIDLDETDVFDALQGAFFGTAELRRDRFGVLLDVNYADLGQDGVAAGTIIPGAQPATANADTTLWMATGAVAYRVYQEEGRSVDFYGGLRYYDVDADFTFSIPSIGFQATRSASPSWVDAIVGLRVQVPIAYGFSFSGLADIGGFGIGESSNLTWEALGTINYAFTDNLSGRVGYRYMSIDNESDDLNLDLSLGGPILGLTWKF